MCKTKYLHISYICMHNNLIEVVTKLCISMAKYALI